MQKHPGTSKRGDNLYFRFKMKSVTADMSDDDLLRLSDGNGRMLDRAGASTRSPARRFCPGKR